MEILDTVQTQVHQHRNMYSQETLDALKDKIDKLRDNYHFNNNRWKSLNKAYLTWKTMQWKKICKVSTYQNKFATWYDELKDEQGWRHIGRLGDCLGKNQVLDLRTYYAGRADTFLKKLNPAKIKLQSYLESNREEIDDARDELDYETELEKLRELQQEIETEKEETRTFAAQADASEAQTSATVAKSNAIKIVAYVMMPIVILIAGFFIYKTIKN